MGITRFPHGVSSFGMPLIGSGPVMTTGKVFFVHATTGSDGNNGESPEQPFATLDYAIGRCTANKNDIIIVMPGHAETVTSAITVDIAGLSIIGIGNGTNRPAFTCNAAIDCIDVTANNVLIENLYFPASTLTGVTSRINAGATHLTVRCCKFQCGQYDLESITVPAAGIDLTVEGCHFIVSANGPDAAIEIESASAVGLIVRNNIFDGGDDTNAWDASAVNSDVAHLNCLVVDNMSVFGAFADFDAAATGIIGRNLMGEGTLGAMLDPGSCMCFENYEADAVDETARAFPATPAS